MKRNVKIFCAALALVLVFGAVVGGTLAWLQDQTQSITNTFTVGNVDIILEESDSLTNFKMVPGEFIDKDPSITVVANSEPAYIFMEVNNSSNLKDFIEYNTTGDWIMVDGSVDPYADTVVYYYNGEYTEGSKIQFLAGNQVKVNEDVTKAMMDAVADSLTDDDLDSDIQPTMTFTAYAVQKSDTFTDAVAAWNATFGA